MLADKHTLLVHFHDADGKCIQCEKCVRACPMGIDIRNSSHQLECTHCAECIDACSGILGKLGRQSLIQYAWGDSGSNAVEEHIWYRRIGLRDGKRIVVLPCSLLYATGLAIAISLRQPVLVRIMPNRITLYTLGADGLDHNTFRMVASNRGKQDARAHAFGCRSCLPHRLPAIPRTSFLSLAMNCSSEFDLTAHAASIAPGVNHVRILVHVDPRLKGPIA